MRGVLRVAAERQALWLLVLRQGVDPTTDIRGAGIYGIESLVKLLRQYPYFRDVRSGCPSVGYGVAGTDFSACVCLPAVPTKRGRVPVRRVRT